MALLNKFHLQNFMSSDGYIDVTSMCREYKKNFNDWYNSDEGKQIYLHIVAEKDHFKPCLIWKNGHAWTIFEMALIVANWCDIKNYYTMTYSYSKMIRGDENFLTSLIKNKEEIDNFNLEQEEHDRLLTQYNIFNKTHTIQDIDFVLESRAACKLKEIHGFITARDVLASYFIKPRFTGRYHPLLSLLKKHSIDIQCSNINVICLVDEIESRLSVRFANGAGFRRISSTKSRIYNIHPSCFLYEWGWIFAFHINQIIHDLKSITASKYKN